MRRFFVTSMMTFLLGLIIACTPPPEYRNENADFAFYKKVAIIPFSNLSNDRTAGDKVTSSFTTELLMRSVVDIANSGDLMKAIREVVKGERTNFTQELSSEEVINLAKAAGVEGIIVGAVTDFGMVRVGSEEFPLVGIDVRFLDGQSGKVIWSYEKTRRGGPGFPVFSFGETHTLGDLTTKVCRQATGQFAETLR